MSECVYACSIWGDDANELGRKSSIQLSYIVRIITWDAYMPLAHKIKFILQWTSIMNHDNFNNSSSINCFQCWFIVLVALCVTYAITSQLLNFLSLSLRIPLLIQYFSRVCLDSLDSLILITCITNFAFFLTRWVEFVLQTVIFS